MILVKEALSKRERKAFVEFPLKLYRGNPYFVPPLYLNEKAIFKKGYCYHEVSESIFLLAYRGREVVGRIQGILQRASNEKWGQKRVRFTRFDAIDDQKVASALFRGIVSWASKKGMEEVVGPLGYSDFEREGLLVEGFDQLSTFEEQYNYPYYQTLVETFGFQKEVDWLERRLFRPEKMDERYLTLSQKILERNGFRIVEGLSIRQICDRYASQVFSLLNETYDDLYQTVPFLESQEEGIIEAFKRILTPKYVRLIVDQRDQLKAFGLCFPAIGKDLQRSGGEADPAHPLSNRALNPPGEGDRPGLGRRGQGREEHRLGLGHLRRDHEDALRRGLGILRDESEFGDQPRDPAKLGEVSQRPAQAQEVLPVSDPRGGNGLVLRAAPSRFETGASPLGRGICPSF